MGVGSWHVWHAISPFPTIGTARHTQIRPASSACCKDLSAPLDEGDQQYTTGALDLLYAGIDGLRARLKHVVNVRSRK